MFVAEADESDGSLLEYTPDVVVVTNIDVDHLDFFGTIERYVAVFDDFADRIVDGGTLVVCLDDPGAAALGGRVAARLGDRGVAVLGYGEGVHAGLAPGVHHVAHLLSWSASATGGQARVRFTAPLVDEPSEFTVGLTLPGKHMSLNGIGAIIGCARLGADLAGVISGIGAFGGVHRRFEFRGRCGGVDVIDDYAHHPTEVAAVLTAARDMVTARTDGPATGRAGRVIAVFQPHLYSRTMEFAGEFATALDHADAAVIADVYGAREQPIPGVSGRIIADRMHIPAQFAPDLSRLAAQVAQITRPGDIVLTLGAGDITMQGPEILAALENVMPEDILPGNAARDDAGATEGADESDRPGRVS